MNNYDYTPPQFKCSGGTYVRGLVYGPIYYLFSNESVNGIDDINKKSYDEYKERKLIQSKKWMR